MSSDPRCSFLVCADLHIGRSLHGRSLYDDQAHILHQIAQLAAQKSVVALIMAGDLFDRSVPSSEALHLADQFFSSLIDEHGLSVILIAGNHDSPERLDFAATLLGKQGLHIVAKWHAEPQCFVFEIAGQRIGIAAVPYVEPSLVRNLLENEQIRDHQEAWQAYLPLVSSHLDRLHLDKRLLLCHAYLAGGQDSESERPLSIGASGIVDSQLFAGFDAVLAGHLHRPQHIRPNIYYAGSPLVYSQSECGQEKSVLLVDLKPDGQLRFEKLALSPLHLVESISDSFENLLARNSSSPDDSYFYLTLTDRQPIFEAFARLQEKFPYLLHVQREAIIQQETSVLSQRRQMVESGEESLIKGFLREMGLDSAEQGWTNLIDQILAEARNGSLEAFTLQEGQA